MLGRIARFCDRGQLIPIVALALTVLMGVTALAVDVGYWRYQQRIEQSAADSAAIAGADELNYPAAADWSAAAKSDATLNGFTDDGSVTVSVTPNNPPTAGAYSGNTSAVEVILKKKQPGLFGAIFGLSSQWVSVRAVAVLSSSGRNCVYGLNPTGNSVLINGATVNAPACGIVSDGSFLINGSTVTARSIGYAASTATFNGSSFPEGQPAPAVAAADPCASIAGCAYLKAHPPSSGTCLTPTRYNGGTTATIPAGRYCSQLLVNGTTNVVFSAGVYEFDNGLLLNGVTNVSGSGVTFYNGPGSAAILINGSTVNLTAPATGNTAGVLIYQNPSNTSGFTVNGSGGGMAGMLYFPTSAVTVNGSLSTWLLVVGSTVLLNGSGMNVPNSAFPGFGHSVLAE